MAVVQIDNDQTLTNILFADMEGILETVAEEITNMVKDRVQEGVYSYPESPYYERLGERGGFLFSWKESLIEKVGNKLNTIISSNADRMYYNPLDEQRHHGNSVDDRRENLDAYIFEGTSYDFGGNAMIPRDYWSDIEAIVDNSIVVDRLFEREFQRRGINFMKIGLF
jgi:hypothetical protein